MKAVYPFVTDYRNLLGYTEDFTNGYWLSANATTTANSTTSPTGINNADTLTETSATGAHGLSSDVISFTSGVSYAFSIYAKNTASGRGFIQLAAYQITASNQNAYCNFDLINGVVGGSGNATGQIQDVGNGWYRCTMVVTSGKTYSERYNVFLVDNINATSLQSYAGNATKGIYIWGSQLEIGTSASAYQPVLATNNYSTNVAAQMKFNLVNPQDSDAAFRLAFSGGWTYSTNGAQPNGTNGYANTFASTSTQNSGSLGFYSRTNSVAASCSLGGAIAQSGIFLTYLANQSFFRINDAGNSAAITTADSLGLFISNRISSTETRNLVKGAIVNQANNSTGTQTVSNYIGALNSAGSAVLYDNKQCAFAFVADGFTDTELQIINTLISSYQTTLSRQV